MTTTIPALAFKAMLAAVGCATIATTTYVAHDPIKHAVARVKSHHFRRVTKMVALPRITHLACPEPAVRDVGPIAPGMIDPLVLDAPIVLPVAAVPLPEPASWLQMIVGFGIVGGMVRRKRGKVMA